MIYFSKIDTLIQVRKVRGTLTFGIITPLTDDGVCKSGCPLEIARRNLDDLTVVEYPECADFSVEEKYACNYDISANGGDTVNYR